MNKIFSLSLLLVFCSVYLNAQDYKDEVFITIDGREITAGEFERVYNKNSKGNESQQQSVEEYLDMFINYKLKVIEAEKLGLDTLNSFQNEFLEYKKQLIKPYLTSEEIREEFAREAYERMKEELQASHIMVRLNPDASAEDTLRAYNKIMEIRERVMNGEDFNKVARATSDDPSAKSNAGHLGWFSAFRMVYPFETAAYNTTVGTISMPVRTKFGYHIIKIHDRRPSKGTVEVAHLFLKVPESMSTEESGQVKEKIEAIYDSLQNGASFEDLVARHSEDATTVKKGGKLPAFGAGEMIPVFDSISFTLKHPGDISQPVRSRYGWHIIKLIDKETIGSFEDEKPEILSRIKQGDRANTENKAFIAQLKEEYNFNFYKDNYQKLLSTIDSSVFQGNWMADKANDYFDLPIFTLGDMEVSVKDLAEFIEVNAIEREPTDFGTLIALYYEPFETQHILEYEINNLENKYPEYKYILQEYHDGILLFDLTDKMVWTRATEDTVGLANYYNENKEDYMWEERAKAYLVEVNDSTILDKVRRKISRRVRWNIFKPDRFVNRICDGEDTASTCLEITQERYEKGANEKIDEMGWEKGVGETFIQDGNPAFYVITDILDPQVKDLEETRGLVISDYQKYLEEQWLKELRDKYDIEVNRDLLSKIKKNV